LSVMAVGPFVCPHHRAGAGMAEIACVSKRDGDDD
jgi:hypothetical protein